MLHRQSLSSLFRALMGSTVLSSLFSIAVLIMLTIINNKLR
ncbi:hypothetical protein [Salibacterium salarium]|nr:hypothetical protein [Salibacterium salarium]